jgi:ribonuclease HII
MEALGPTKKRGRGPTPVAAGSRKATKATPSEGKTASKAKTTSAAHASRSREEAAWGDGIPLVIGCDEAGRGPLAGPVVAAACALPASVAPILGVGDSKTITDEAAREALYERIVSTPGVRWSARIVSASRIDEINILMGSLEAMRLSIVDVLKASEAPRALALVDGPFSPWKEGEKYVNFQEPPPPKSTVLDVEPIKGGDAKVYCIAAASIIAKVTRDRCMHAYAAEWPQYGLNEHKGYPTPAHVAAISKHGPCAIHRRTFAPLKSRELPPASKAELARVDSIIAEHIKQAASGLG